MEKEILSLVQGENMPYVLAALTFMTVFLFLLVLYLLIAVSRLKGRYREMMTGEETGRDFESMLLRHIEETHAVAAENRDLQIDNRRISELLDRAVTRVGVVRFRAFEDMGSDLSYAVALLDAHNDGVVLSSIFGREDSRSYVKPIEAGKSTYTLTNEEDEAIRQAMQSAR
ncbi:MAG: DUF4446 family protein [Schwartzia sp. (in: firmicutes)]